MITKAKLLELVDDFKFKEQVDGFVCVGYGINHRHYGVEVPFSLTDLLGIGYTELYRDTKDTTNGYPRMVMGNCGAVNTDLYYITQQKYDFLLDTLIQ